MNRVARIAAGFVLAGGVACHADRAGSEASAFEPADAARAAPASRVDAAGKGSAPSRMDIGRGGPHLDRGHGHAGA